TRRSSRRRVRRSRSNTSSPTTFPRWPRCSPGIRRRRESFRLVAVRESRRSHLSPFAQEATGDERPCEKHEVVPVATRETTRLLCHSVQPLETKPLHPSRRALDTSGHEVERRTELQQQRNPEHIDVVAQPP